MVISIALSITFSASDNENNIEYDDFISYNKCKLDFDKQCLEVINHENILTRQELKGFVDSFKEEEEKKKLL